LRATTGDDPKPSRFAYPRMGFCGGFCGATFSIFKGLAGILLAALLIWTPGAAHAGYASIVVDADSGRILHATNADTRNYPASLTKMMTLFMVFEALDAGKWTMNTDLKVSARAARQPASRLGLKRGETISVKEAILALVTKSANDVATVVAENLAKSERDFAMMMTTTARKLNMTRTTFRNASGLPNRGQMSTARDMARLSRALLHQHRKYYHFFSTKAFRYDGRKHTNHNKLLTTYEGTDGIKTGYIRASGFNLVASVKRNDTRLIGVVFGGRNSNQRNRIMTKLLNKGFAITDGRRKPRQVIAQAAPAPAPAKQPVRRSGDQQKLAWAVQVGAYAKYSQAYKSAKVAMRMASGQLGEGEIKIVPLKTRRGNMLYRARIHGLDKREAYAACRALERKSRDCMELRVTDLQLAENTR
jgi:D-alanyl-D-alanine carboxypeptidase